MNKELAITLAEINISGLIDICKRFKEDKVMEKYGNLYPVDTELKEKWAKQLEEAQQVYYELTGNTYIQ